MVGLIVKVHRLKCSPSSNHTSRAPIRALPFSCNLPKKNIQFIVEKLKYND